MVGCYGANRYHSLLGKGKYKILKPVSSLGYTKDSVTITVDVHTVVET